MSSKLTTQPTEPGCFEIIKRLEAQVVALWEVSEALADRIDKIVTWHTIEKEYYSEFRVQERSLARSLFWAAQAEYKWVIQEDEGGDLPDDIYFFTPPTEATEPPLYIDEEK